MSEINDKLNEKLRQQMDGMFDEDEEHRRRSENFAFAESLFDE